MITLIVIFKLLKGNRKRYIKKLDYVRNNIIRIL